MMKLAFLFSAFALILPALQADESGFGTLIFEDYFERSESQELKDEPGNEWTTSSDKTAAGNKEVDLRDGAMYIYTHKDANHATSVRHAFAFTDGTIGLRFKLEAEDDSLMLNFADLDLKSVHAGHLFKVYVNHEGVKIADQKTGEMNLELRNAKKNGTLTNEQRKAVSAKGKTFPNPVSLNEWHQIYVTVKGEELTCSIDGELAGSFSSEGFAHETKTLLRLLVAKNAYVDDVKIWRQK
ncbi:MAG: hypothetical protein P1U86_16155 [Verrucomicrobiales bacterium]|nr:hypothetical protein [Verrucomicrobiales bacterium]